MKCLSLKDPTCPPNCLRHRAASLPPLAYPASTMSLDDSGRILVENSCTSSEDMQEPNDHQCTADLRLHMMHAANSYQGYGICTNRTTRIPTSVRTVGRCIRTVRTVGNLEKSVKGYLMVSFHTVRTVRIHLPTVRTPVRTGSYESPHSGGPPGDPPGESWEGTWGP